MTTLHRISQLTALVEQLSAQVTDMMYSRLESDSDLVLDEYFNFPLNTQEGILEESIADSGMELKMVMYFLHI